MEAVFFTVLKMAGFSFESMLKMADFFFFFFGGGVKSKDLTLQDTFVGLLLFGQGQLLMLSALFVCHCDCKKRQLKQFIFSKMTFYLGGCKNTQWVLRHLVQYTQWCYVVEYNVQKQSRCVQCSKDHMSEDSQSLCYKKRINLQEAEIEITYPVKRVKH